jgi:hypothetical protein
VANLSPQAVAAWRAHRARTKTALAAAIAVSRALDSAHHSPSGATLATLAQARRDYDQAEHEVALAALAAERLTDTPDLRWAAVRAARDAGRRAYAAAPQDAAGAAADAHAAANALAATPAPAGPAGAIVRRSALQAIEFARDGAHAAERRLDWPAQGSAPEPQAELQAALARASAAARACAEAVTEAEAIARRAAPVVYVGERTVEIHAPAGAGGGGMHDTPQHD